MRRSPADSTNRSLAAFGKLQHIPLFEYVAAIEMALVVEMVVDRGMDGGECLQGLDVSEPSHRPFPAFERVDVSFPPGC